jgi:hypothetical protein
MKRERESGSGRAGEREKAFQTCFGPGNRGIFWGCFVVLTELEHLKHSNKILPFSRSLFMLSFDVGRNAVPDEPDDGRACLFL